MTEKQEEALYDSEQRLRRQAVKRTAAAWREIELEESENDIIRTDRTVVGAV